MVPTDEDHDAARTATSVTRVVPGRAATYALICLILFMAFLVRWGLDPILGDTLPYSIFLVLVAFAALKFGDGPAVLALLISICAAYYYFVPERYSFVAKVVSDRVGFVLCLFAGVALILLARAARIAHERAEALLLEAKEHAAQRQKAERTVRSIIDSASEFAIFTLNHAGEVTTWNLGAERLLGYPAAEIVGKHVRLLYPPEDAELRLAQAPLEQARNASRTDYEGWYVRKDAGKIWVSGMLMPLMQGERIEGFLGILRDSTERHRSEQNLIASGQRLRELVDSEKLARESTQRAAERLHVLAVGSRTLVEAGNDEASVLNALARVIAHQVRDACLVHLLDEATSTFQLVAQRHVDPDNHEFARNVAERSSPQLGHTTQEPRLLIVPIRSGNRVLGALTAERLQASETYDEADFEVVQELAARAALTLENVRLLRETQEAAQAREEMMAIVAHDLRNPLALITMSGSVLQRWAPDDAQGRKIRGASERILKAARRMEQLIADLLDATNIERGQFEITPRALAVPALLEQAADMFVLAAKERGITLESQAVDPSVLISGDEPRLLQVFSNLLANALRFTPDGGRISIAAEVRDELVVFSVSDSGSGISEQHLPHIFERYWKAPGKKGGTGLGLYISRGVISAHGGELSVESQVDVGTTFRFTVNRHHPATAANSLAPHLVTAEASMQPSLPSPKK